MTPRGEEAAASAVKTRLLSVNKFSYALSTSKISDI